MGPTAPRRTTRGTGEQRGQQWRQRRLGQRGKARATRGRRGGTQLYDAIFLASDELMKRQDGRKALVVFSDGVDRGSKRR